MGKSSSQQPQSPMQGSTRPMPSPGGPIGGIGGGVGSIGGFSPGQPAYNMNPSIGGFSVNNPTGMSGSGIAPMPGAPMTPQPMGPALGAIPRNSGTLNYPGAQPGNPGMPNLPAYAGGGGGGSMPSSMQSMFPPNPSLSSPWGNTQTPPMSIGSAQPVQTGGPMPMQKPAPIAATTMPYGTGGIDPRANKMALLLRGGGGR